MKTNYFLRMVLYGDSEEKYITLRKEVNPYNTDIDTENGTIKIGNFEDLLLSVTADENGVYYNIPADSRALAGNADKSSLLLEYLENGWQI